MISLQLPWPPTVNTYWRNVGGRVLISERGRAYRRAVVDAVWAQRGAKAPIAGPVILTLELSPPDAARRDLDNLFKAPLDALTHAGVWEDDSQVQSMLALKDGRGGTLGLTIIQVDASASLREQVLAASARWLGPSARGASAS